MGFCHLAEGVVTQVEAAAVVSGPRYVVRDQIVFPRSRLNVRPSYTP
jgi:hypothetical protein